MISPRRFVFLLAVSAVGVACSVRAKPLPPFDGEENWANPSMSGGAADAGAQALPRSDAATEGSDAENPIAIVGDAGDSASDAGTVTDAGDAQADAN